MNTIAAKISATAALCLTGLVALTSCSPKTVLTVGSGAEGKATFSSEITPTAETIVRRFTGADAALFNKEEIVASLTQAGISVGAVTFPTQSSVSINMTLPKLDGMLEKAVKYSVSGKKISVSLSRESVQAAMAVMPAGMNDYLDLLMAPVFTGETLSAAEYVEVIRSAYGKTLGDELEKSAFILTVRCPSPVTAVTIDKPGAAAKSNGEATFRIPLANLLAMEDPITATAQW